MLNATKSRCLIVQTPHKLAVLTPCTSVLLPIRFDNLLANSVTESQLQQLQTALADARTLPVDIGLSASLLPIGQHAVPTSLRHGGLRRFLRHHYPDATQTAGYCVQQADQRTTLLCCGLTTTTLQHVLTFWRQRRITPRSVAPLICLMPIFPPAMPGTHLILLNTELERSLGIVIDNRVQAVINQGATFEDLFRCLIQHAPQQSWEQGINVLTDYASPPLALDYTPWLDAWYWFRE